MLFDDQRSRDRERALLDVRRCLSVAALLLGLIKYECRTKSVEASCEFAIFSQRFEQFQ